ncbi:MAG TPA: kelch repeat-containing protein, partial [Polyangia bacterium]|nr:kelch repeat-containing protein [Polyangia bacterium]
MAPCLRRLLPWLVVAAASCSSHKGPPLRVVLAHSATSDARCVPPSGTQAQDTALASAQVATLRLTIRRHVTADDAGTFVCDRVLQVPRDAPAVEVPAGGAGTFDLYGEAFAAPVAGAAPTRLAVGALSNVSFAAKTLPDLRLYPAEAFACANQHMQRPRAFHSATLLPNGQLLIVGGLTTGEDATVDTFAPNPLYVAADAEVYDPATGLFTTIVEGAPPTPRAFHQAALVGTTAPYHILVVGGVTVADTKTPAMGLNTGAGSGTRLIPFDTSGSVFNPLTTTAAGAELITYDPDAHTIKRAPFAGFTPGAFQAGATFGDGLVVADGIDWMGNPLAATIPAIKQVAVSRALESPPRTAA